MQMVWFDSLVSELLKQGRMRGLSLETEVAHFPPVDHPPPDLDLIAAIGFFFRLR